MVVPYGPPEFPHSRKFAFDSYVFLLVQVFGTLNLSVTFDEFSRYLVASMEWERWQMNCL